MKESNDYKYIPMTSISSGKEREVGNDIYYYTNQIVNVIFLGNPNEGEWVLVDAGMPKSGSKILEIAEKRFGKGNKPSAIILTHGHFDHVGGLMELVQEWKVPVYAHIEEFPFLLGEMSYPEPDSSVQGGMLAKISSIYPTEPIDITEALFPLPEDFSIPILKGWKWVHTPGHSPGHISLFREQDKVLISGDAFITVKQDSFYKVLVQKEEINGPPRYLTINWQAAWESVRKLEELQPQIVIPGHGSAMSGEKLTKGLQKLVNEFDTMAIPDHGKYVDKKSQ